MEKINIESAHSNLSSEPESAQNDNKAIFDFLFDFQTKQNGWHLPSLSNILNPFAINE